MASIKEWLNEHLVQPVIFITMGNVEMDEWHARYDAAHDAVRLARTAHTAALLSVGEAELAVRIAEEKLRAIFKEKVDLSDPTLNCPPHTIIK